MGDTSEDRAAPRAGSVRSGRPAPPPADRWTLLPSPSQRRAARVARAAAPLEVDERATPRRLRTLLVLTVVCALAVVAKLVDLQVFEAPEMEARARKQLVRTDTLPAERGSIFDREGRDLAISVRVPTIAADPRLVTDPDGQADLLAELLGVDRDVIAERLSRPGSKFAYVARRVTPEAAERVKARQAELPGVFAIMEPQRFLPAEALAASLLGKVGVEGDGLTGLEHQYDDQLRGTPGKLVAERDLQGREIPGGRIEHDPSARGDDLVLTIDRSVQHEAERRLAAQIAATGARGGMALVMDTTTGELLAIANLEVDPTSGEVRPSTKDSAVTDVYEPGSVAKLITVAGAIEDRAIQPDQVLTVPEKMWVADHEFSDHDPHPTAAWSVTDIVANSSNVGTIMIAKALGKQRFDHYLRAFGFGSRTGLGTPGESPGILKHPDAYTGTDMGSFPIGQGIATTAVQVLAAYNAVANGGVYVAPRLVQATVGPDGVRRPVPTTEPRRVISQATSAELAKMLTEVVRVGTGTLASVDGYEVAGKTGTARKPKVGSLGYEDGAYVSSFAGFVPAQAPRLTSMVVLDKPTPIFGGVVAAPVFADLARYGLRELRIPPPPGSALVGVRAKDADVQAAQGVGDVGDSRAPSTTALRASATATTRPSSAKAAGATPTSAKAPGTTTTTTTGARAARSGPPASTAPTATVGRRPTTPTTRR